MFQSDTKSGPHPSNSATNHLSCPICKGSLSEFRFYQETVDICRRGCGLWLDAGELPRVEGSDKLEKIDQAFEGQYEKQDLKQALENDLEHHCPRDKALLNRYEWNVGSGIVLDGCTKCQGIWMDAGELEGYAHYVKAFRQHPPELTPELRAQMDRVRVEMESKWEESLNKTANALVPWDLWFIDDLRRHLIKTVGRTL